MLQICKWFSRGQSYFSIVSSFEYFHLVTLVCGSSSGSSGTSTSSSIMYTILTVLMSLYFSDDTREDYSCI